MRIPTLINPTFREQHGRIGRTLTIAGGVVVAVSAYLPWAYSRDALDNMTFLGGPSPLQYLGLALGLIAAIAAAMSLVEPALRARGAKVVSVLKRFAWLRGARTAAISALIYLVVVLLAIALELGGLVTIEWGGWVGLVGALVAVAGSMIMPIGRVNRLSDAKAPAWLEIICIAILLGVGMLAVAYTLNQNDGGTFLAMIAFLSSLSAILAKLGIGAWLSGVSKRHRNVLVFAAFAAAFLFPFTQNGSDQNMSIATQVLVFAATAVGLNIVVGLAGLLDLGYIAFLGAGAFTAAVLSQSAFATVGWKPPFIVVMLISGVVAAALGLIIGSPTLRVSGDYLAIVTLAFGEIFRITMNNLDGADGPNLTNGNSGIPAIPNLNLFGFDFGVPHVVAGIPLGRFSNYFFLMLLVMALIVLVFTRLNYSRIGRGWVAIREDERAAEAMGVNVFGLKLLAFAGGAFLAGFAGAVKAHVDVSVTPEQYVFLESAFLLAAVVLGGMGTVLGVIIGATLLKLLPEKLRFVNEYRLLIFGLLMVLMMRFRPEGLVPNSRRQLEFHADDEQLASDIGEEHPYEFAEKSR